MSIAGLLYGTTVGIIAPLVLGIWQEVTFLLVFLSIFLFLINFVTGVFFYSLLKFFIISIKWGEIVIVELWYIENMSILFLRKIKFLIIVIGTFYIALCMMSIIFFSNILPPNKYPIIIGYATFSILIMIGMFIIPEIPIIRKFLSKKRKELEKINIKIQKEYNRFNFDDTNISDLDLNKIDQLLKLKSQIEPLGTWSTTFRMIRTGIGIIIVSLLPITIQIILDNILKNS
jgi:hypothetical protein